MKTFYDSKNNQLNLIEERDIESSDNYIKFPDGTLICYGRANIEVNLDKLWLNHYYQYFHAELKFSIPFINTPIINVGTKSNLITTINAYTFDNEMIGALYLVSPQQIKETTEFWYTAIGKWK